MLENMSKTSRRMSPSVTKLLSRYVALSAQALNGFRMHVKSVRSFDGGKIVVECHCMADLLKYCCATTISKPMRNVKSK